MGYTWIPSTNYSGVQPNAVFAGQDSDGSAIYVGRAFHGGDQLPAKVIPSKNVAYVAYDGQEIPVSSFEVLCGHGFTWIPSSGGSVPPNAVMSGNTANGEPLFIGRGHWEGSLTPGKIHRSHGCLYISHGGAERSLPNYEVLVSQESWIKSSGYSEVPPEAVFAGQDSDGDPIYVGRSFHGGDHLPAKVIPRKNVAYISYDGQEIAVSQYEILCGTGYTWVGSASGHVPPNAVTTGRTADGEQLYIGRGHWEGSLTPGKVHPSHGCLYIPYGGGERSLTQYEVLVKQY